LPELDFVVLADGVTHRPDGKIDIFGAGFDTIWAPNVPVQHAQLAIAVRVLITQHEAESAHALDLILMSEDGPEIARAHADIQPVAEEDRSQLPAGEAVGFGAILNFQGLIFPAYGRYHIAVLWDGNELRGPLRLRLSQLPPTPPGA
jgi:hypothetical protein